MVVVSALALAACGDDDAGNADSSLAGRAASSPEGSDDALGDDRSNADVGEDDEADVDADTGDLPPSEKAGTVTLGDVTYELEASDFDVLSGGAVAACDATEEGLVVSAVLEDGTPFVIESRMDGDGMVVTNDEAEFPDDLELTWEAQGVSGSATTTSGPLQFFFRC